MYTTMSGEGHVFLQKYIYFTYYNAPLDTCLNVYYSIFYTHLSYGCNVWGLTSETNLQKIEVLQRKCLRIMTFAPYDSPTNQKFIDLKLIKVRDIIKMNQLKLVYNFHIG